MGRIHWHFFKEDQIVRMKPFSTDWDSNPCAGTETTKEHQNMPVIKKTRHQLEIKHFSVYGKIQSLGSEKSFLQFVPQLPGGQYTKVFHPGVPSGLLSEMM